MLSGPTGGNVADVSREPLDVRREVLEAEKRIRFHVRQTPLEPSLWLSQITGAEVYLKLENLQITSSFKYRGAANAILSLSEDQRRRGVVTASTGNHGTAMAYLLRKLGLHGSIYVPETASSAKIDALRLVGGDLVLAGTDGVEAERAARSDAEQHGRVYVSPYNDPWVVGGQGTIGLELEEQLEGIEAVFCPVGGGGLAAGIAGYLKAGDARLQIIGCQPQRSCVMFESIRAGRILDLPSLPTLADGTAGGIESDTLTFEICRDRIDEFVLVDESAIATAIRLVLEKHHLLIEGAAALPVAALLSRAESYRQRRVVLVLTGARISLSALRRVLADRQPASGRFRAVD